MPEEEMQLDLGTDEGTTETAETGQPDMSDDDVAALLGFTTTLSEQMMPQDEESTEEGEMGDAEQGEGMATPEKIEEETPGTPDKDEEQDKEIADIRAQLEQLLAEENDESETEDTETTG